MKNLIINSLHKKLIIIVLLSLIFTSFNSIFAADDTFGPDYPWKDADVAKLTEQFYSLKNWWKKDNETMVAVFQSDKTIEKSVNEYIVAVQTKVATLYESRKKFNSYLAYFDAMKVAWDEYESLQTKIDSIEKLPVWDLDKMNKDTLRRYVLLTVDQQALWQYINTNFPFYYLILSIKQKNY